MNNDSKPSRTTLRHLLLSVILRRMGLVVLVMAAALLSVTARAQQARVATLSPEALPVAARADLLPVDLQEEPLRRSLRRVLNRAAGRQAAAYKTAAGVGRPARIMADPLEETRLVADDGAEGYQCGFSVSMDGDHALVGAFGDDTNGLYAGSAYIFSLSGETWQQEAKLMPTDGELFDFFGWSVALSGDRALVGAFGDDAEKGAAYVFEFNGSSWQQTAKLTASGGAMFDDFGISVALDGDRALVGAFGVADNGVYSGAAYVFEFNGSSWQQTAKLTASDALEGDNLGVSVALSGDRALVGADGVDDNGAASGAAYVFEFNGSSWQQVAKLTAPDGADYDFFGNAVSLDDDHALIGAPLDDDNGSGSGSAYVFEFNGVWQQAAKLTASDGADFDDFGASVSLDDDHLFIGSVGTDDNGASSGGAYLFAKDGTAWTEEAKLTASDGAAGDFFGSVSMSEGRFLVGAAGADNTTGAAYCYESDEPSEPPLLHPYLFLADEKVVIHSPLASVGDLHSNGEIEIKKGNPSTHYGSLAAVDDIKIEKDNTIVGDAIAGGSVDLIGNATVTGAITEGADVDPIPLPSLSFSAGGPDIFVDKNETLSLPPGSYGDAKIEVNGTLILASGDYFFEKLELEKEATLRTDVSGGPVTINVVSGVVFEKETEVDIVPLGEAGSPYVTLNTYDNVTIKKDARFLGTILAPDGNVVIEKDGFFKGLICAKQIEVKKDGTLLFHGADIPLLLPAAVGNGRNGKKGKKSKRVQTAQADLASMQAVPEDYHLAANYPNPFNPTTTITFALPAASAVRLTVYDVTGRAVAHLLNEPKAAGWHAVRFDASALPSGVYLYHIVAGSFVETRRMVLVK